MENKNPIWSRLWLIWMSSTALYLALYFYAIETKDFVISHLAGVIGLFVPFGFWNTAMALDNSEENYFFRISTLLVTLLVIFFGDKLLSKFTALNPLSKIIVNLIVLGALTYLVDMILWGEWLSGSLATKGVIDSVIFSF